MAKAARLFTEAKHEMELRHWEIASSLLAESDALDPHVGTKVNLALCYEQLGRTATACSAWRDAALAAELAANQEPEEAQRKFQESRRVYALARIAALDPQISRLSVTLSPGVAVESVSIYLDGSSVPSARWGEWLAVDPGAHRLEASSPSRRPWSFAFQVQTSEARMISVSVPILEAIPESPPPDHPGWRSTALAAGAIALGSAAVGTLFGVLAIQAHDRTATDCAGATCSGSGASDSSQLRAYAIASDIAFGVAGGATAATLAFWFLGAGSERPRNAVRVAPTIGATTGLSLRGDW